MFARTAASIVIVLALCAVTRGQCASCTNCTVQVCWTPNDPAISATVSGSGDAYTVSLTSNYTAGTTVFVVTGDSNDAVSVTANGTTYPSGVDLYVHRANNDHQGIGSVGSIDSSGAGGPVTLKLL